MRIVADKEDLKNVSDDLVKSSKSVNDEIDLWEKSILELKQIWQGKDADMFYNRIDEYLLKLRMLSAASNSIGGFINKVNNTYIKKDEEFANELKKENDLYESNYDREPVSEPEQYSNN